MIAYIDIVLQFLQMRIKDELIKCSERDNYEARQFAIL